MILSMSGQMTQFLRAVVLGGALGVIFDLFRVLRRLFRHPWLLTQAEDLLYWLLALAALFLFLVYDHQVRPFSLLGTFLGILVYFLTFSPLLVRGLVSILRFLGRLIVTLLKMLWFPFGWLLKILAAPAHAGMNKGRSAAGKAKNRWLGTYNKLKEKRAAEKLQRQNEKSKRIKTKPILRQKRPEK